MNSEDIKNRFGSYHVKVMQQDQDHRVASLYSDHGNNAVCRTLAVTYFWHPTPPEVMSADQLIRQGHSIGSTLSGTGLLLKRQSLLEAITPSGASFELLTAGTVRPGTPLVLRLYRLDAGIFDRSLSPYATIAEAHHPEHIAPKKVLPPLASLSENPMETIEEAALTTLLANLE